MSNRINGCCFCINGGGIFILPEAILTDGCRLCYTEATIQNMGAVWCYQEVFRENNDSFRFDEETKTEELTLPDGTPAYLLSSPYGDYHLTWAWEYEFVLTGTNGDAGDPDRNRGIHRSRHT